MSRKKAERSLGHAVPCPGTRIAGRYEVAGRPMMGGMGIVCVCLDLEEDRPVALKTFRPEYLPNRAARDRFLREGTHWVELGDHPHIVRCYHVLYIDPEVYLILELVAKEQGRDDASLRSWLTPGVPLPAETALLFALQIARGMQHAAESIPGFVHRDLKPGNVLVGADHLSGASVNRLRVTDFGLVRALGGGQVVQAVGDDEQRPARPGLTRLGSIMGTPPYMAPEQWDGPDVDLRADIYALGCILGEMLSGQRLVVERTMRGYRQAHQRGRAAEVTVALPGSLAGVLSRCLAVDRSARYASWTEVKAALATAYQAVTRRPAPVPEAPAAQGRAERVAAGWSYNALGEVYLDLGQAEMALGYFERARAAGHAEREPPLEGAGLTHLGLAYADLGDAGRSIDYYEQALTIARETGDRRGEGAVLGNLGLVYVELGDAGRSIGCLEQRLATAREIGDWRGEAAALGNLGLAYAELGNAGRSIIYCEQALTMLHEIGDRRGQGIILGNLGIAYAELGDAHRAIGYCEQQLAIAREIGDRHGEGSALGNLGTAYAVLGDAWRATEFYSQATAIFEEIGDVMRSARAGFNLALLLVHQERHAAAMYHARRAAKIFVQIGHDQHAQQAQQLLARIQARMG